MSLVVAKFITDAGTITEEQICDNVTQARAVALYYKECGATVTVTPFEGL